MAIRSLTSMMFCSSELELKLELVHLEGGAEGGWGNVSVVVTGCSSFGAGDIGDCGMDGMFETGGEVLDNEFILLLTGELFVSV